MLNPNQAKSRAAFIFVATVYLEDSVSFGCVIWTRVWLREKDKLGVGVAMPGRSCAGASLILELEIRIRISPAEEKTSLQLASSSFSQ